MKFRGKEIIPPEGIRTDAFVIRPVVTSDAQLDYDAVMESKEFLRLWEGSTWPEDDFTVAANLEDLEKMVQWHRDGDAFGYTVMNPTETECFGCVYINPPEARWLSKAEVTATNGGRWSDIEAVISFWVRQSRLAEEMDRQLLDLLRPWFDEEWSFGPYVILATEPFVQQVAMIEQTDLDVQFLLDFPGDAGRSRAYA